MTLTALRLIPGRWPGYTGDTYPLDLDQPNDRLEAARRIAADRVEWEHLHVPTPTAGLDLLRRLTGRDLSEPLLMGGDPRRESLESLAAAAYVSPRVITARDATVVEVPAHLLPRARALVPGVA